MATIREIVTALDALIIWGPPPATEAQLQRRYAEIILSDDDGGDWGSIERKLIADFGTLADAKVTRDILKHFGDEVEFKQGEASRLGALLRGFV